jgi:hypothetical protein
MSRWEVRHLFDVRHVIVPAVTARPLCRRRLRDRLVQTRLDVREGEVALGMGFEEGVESR